MSDPTRSPMASAFRRALSWFGFPSLVALVSFVAAGPAVAAPVFSLDHGVAARAEAIPAGSTVLRVDPAAVAALRRAPHVEVALPLGNGETVTLALEAFDVFAPGAVVTSTDAAGAHAIVPDVSLYRGAVVGEPGSRAVLSFSPSGVIGVIDHAGRRFGVGPLRPGARGAMPAHVVGEASVPAHPAFVCGADALPFPKPPARSGSASPERSQPGAVTESTDRLWMDLAVDCDYEYFAHFDSSLQPAIDYAATLVGVVSGIYENDVNVAIRLSYLNVWTTASDPYTATNTQNELPEFQNWWNANRTTVSRHTAHLLSGRSLGGGIAYLTVLCDRGQAYGVSQVDGVYSYPSSATTWDAYVLSHELGHNFSSPHTQSCFWQANGYCAPGALLDSCYASEGGCYSGPTSVPPNGGTIMSYCHLQGPIASTMRLEFHSACKLLIRGHAEQCLPSGAFDPSVSLAASATGSTVHLAWHPSPAAGVLHYDVYRSGVSLAATPQLVASTTDTTWDDPGRIGAFFYRVRAVRASDASAFSNEARIEACLQGGTSYVGSGAAALAPLVIDWNRDGIRDVVVANNIPAGTVSLLLGNGAGGVGDGTFAAALADTAGNKPSGLASEDLDEDGIPDLVVTNDTGAGTFTVLRSGSAAPGDLFGSPVSYATGSNPTAAVIADFDEDGVLDVATANAGGAGVSVALGIPTHAYSGVGTGTFAAATTSIVGSGPVDLAAGDFNEDGVLDLAVLKSSGTVSILFGNGAGGRGNGTFAVGPGYATGSMAAAIATGDFNEDGIRDLAVARNLQPATVAVLLGRGSAGVGDGTFFSRVEYPAGNFADAIAAADYNADGITDLVVTTGENPGRLAVLFGHGAASHGDGTFDSPVFRTLGALPSGVAAGDFNGDGGPDLAVAHSANGQNLGVVLAACAGGLDGTLHVIAPNGGESWPVTAERTIAWTRGPRVTAVDLELSRDLGAHWEVVARGVTDTAFTWTVTDPQTSGNQALIRVVDPLAPSGADQSDAAFTIAQNPLTGVPTPVAAALALDVSPNPARARFRVAFTLPRAESAWLELLDVGGRRIAVREVGALGAGRHTVDLGRESRLASGLYFVRLVQGERSMVARAAIVR